MEREAFLARVRAAVAIDRVPGPPAEDPGLLVPSLPTVDLVERFTEALQAVEGVVHTEDPAGVIAEVAARHEATEYLSWDPEQLPVTGLLDELDRRGLRRVEAAVPAEGRADHQLSYRGLRLGITGAEAGLAESGSIVLRSGPGRPRMASLVPLVHVALLPAGRLHRSLAHWAAEEAGSAAEAANLVVISGPSRTGDIEQHLTLGVHGPKHVHVVLV